MDNTLPTLAIGFFLGIKHAFEADHMVAVTTLVTEHKNPFKASLIGTFWGIGHTTTLFVAGLLVLLLKISIPDRVGLFLEMLVGIMLVVLGTRTLLRRNITIHEHPHHHSEEEHTHLHTNHHHQHKRSFAVGAVHGMAGSGALMVLVLATIRSTIEGIYYILVFGVGSIAGMTLMSLLVGLPFIYSINKFNRMETYLKTTAGIASIAFGIYVIYTIGFVEGLFT